MYMISDISEKNLFSGLDFISVLDGWSSLLPEGKYFIFDAELICVYAYEPCHISKSPKKELIGKKYGEFPNRFLPICEDKFLDALHGNPIQTEIEFDYHTFRIQISSISLPESKDKFVFLSELDITEEKRKEKDMLGVLEKQLCFLKQEEGLYKEIISIFNWRQEIEGKGGNRIWMKQALPNLNISLMQGSGIGALITTVGAVLEIAEKEETNAKIPLPFLNLLEDNFVTTKRLIQTMADAQIVFEESNMDMGEVTLGEVIHLVEIEADYLKDMFEIKKQQFIGSVLTDTNKQKIKICKKSLQSIVREVLINAMKYSPNMTNIMAIFLRTERDFIIKFINPPNYKEIEDLDCRNSEEIALFQPFFRLQKAVDERYVKEEFGIGLGLPVVKKLCEDMNAKVYFTISKSNIYENESKEICISLRFPME